MKLSAVLSTITLLSPAFATPTHLKRDIATIQGVLTDINTQVNSLGTAITTSPLDADSILAQSDTLVQTITEGTTTVNAQPVLNQMDALGLVGPTQQLADDTQTTVDSLIAVKADILALGEGCTTLEALQDQHAAAVALAEAVVSKVPAALADIAQGLADSISAAIQSGIDSYQGSCDNVPTSTATSTAEPTSTATEPTSTATEPTSTATEPTSTATEPTSTTSSTTRTACPAPTK